MMKIKFVFFGFSVFFAFLQLGGKCVFAQPAPDASLWRAHPDYAWARLHLRQAPFPHPSRANGYAYAENPADSTIRKFFPRHPHYDDSTAIVIIPQGFRLVQGGNDLIIHFHGWWNEVDSVRKAFGLVEQLIASRKNAILVLAQGPFRAPDSRGGKMEDDDGLRRLVEEILQTLKMEKKNLFGENRPPHFERAQRRLSPHRSGGGKRRPGEKYSRAVFIRRFLRTVRKIHSVAQTESQKSFAQHLHRAFGRRALRLYDDVTKRKTPIHGSTCGQK